MKLPIYQVDAFTDHVFGGNPGAVVPLENWIPDDVMQNIAIENNLSETGFFVRCDDDDAQHDFHIRYFTPGNEVKFCGHVTLATGYVIMNILEPDRSELTFKSANGAMHIQKDGDFIIMDVPQWPIEKTDVPESLIDALRKTPLALYKGEYWMALFETQQDIESLAPDFRRLSDFNKADAIICTAPANDADTDFVSRFFCPRYGIDEDPVTGSAHSILASYWSQELGKNTLKAKQISKRGGDLWCDIKGDRVQIKGQGVLYMTGEIVV